MIKKKFSGQALEEYSFLIALISILIMVILIILHFLEIFNWSLFRTIIIGFVIIGFLGFIYGRILGMGENGNSLPLWEQKGVDLLFSILWFCSLVFLFLAAVNVIDWSWYWVPVVGCFAPFLLMFILAMGGILVSGLWEIYQRISNSPSEEISGDDHKNEVIDLED